MNFFENTYRLINKYNQKTKKARTYGTDDLLYPAEVHVIEMIGSYHKITTTKLAGVLGITKGAVSQTTNKLLEKELIMKEASIEKTNEVFISLSEKGKVVFSYHRGMHENMMKKVDSLLKDLSPESVSAIDKVFQVIEQSLDEI